jgi:hypothetical protein
VSYPFSRTSSWLGPGSHALAQAQADGYRQGVEAAAKVAEEYAHSYNISSVISSFIRCAAAIRALLPPSQEEKP